MAQKENNKKNHAAREKWLQSKKEGRPKQTYVYNNGTHWEGAGSGHWEKVK